MTELNRVKFIHLRRHLDCTPAAKGGHTIAYIVHPDEGGMNEVIYDVATCSPKDHYNRSIGREVAAGRLRKCSGNHHLFIPETDNPITTILHHFYKTGVV